MLRTKDFKYFVEKKALIQPTSWDCDIVNVALELFEKMYKKDLIYRSSGVVLENLINSSDIQMSLFTNNEKEKKKEELGKCVDKLSQKYKKNIVKIGYAESPKND